MPAAGPELIRDAVCPFCSLLCDDLTIRREGSTLRVRNNGCARAERGFSRGDRSMPPHVHGEPSTLQEAVAQAAAILRNARQPLITGMAADVAGCRAAVALAEACGAVVDHAHGEAAMQNLRVLQSKGWMLTTLSELKNRADVLLLVGTTAVANYPRFFERFVWNRQALGTGRRSSRQVVYLGDATRVPARQSARGPRPTLVRCAGAQIAEMLGALRSLLRGARPEPGRLLTPQKLASLKKLCGTLKSARYGVIVWAPAEFEQEHADVIIRALCDLITDLNAATRFSGLSLAGNDGGMTCQNVTAWQSGFPLRVNFATGEPVYDPALYGTAALLRNGAADALLWLNSLNPDLRPPACKIPLIALTRPSRRAALDAEVFIPVAAPGLDHRGVLFRADSVVSLPLRPLRRTEAVPAADVLSAILRRF